MRSRWTAAVCALFATARISHVRAIDVDLIVVKGSHLFYQTNGSEFFVRGVVYQNGGASAALSSSVAFVDPFSDGPTCERDIAYLQELRTNVVRSYIVNPDADHSACMNALAAAGIYVITGLQGNQDDQRLNETAPVWDHVMYDRFTSVIDAFHNYTNLLGFMVGSETFNITSTGTAPFVKAAVRDVKAYIKKQGYRNIPVGYATGDDSDVIADIADYMNCGRSEDSIDLLGWNTYSWCGNSSFRQSGWNDRLRQFSTYSVPIILSEYGCTQVIPREFSETPAIYSDNMTEVFSGGIVYQYFDDSANFGLVAPDGDTVVTHPGFPNLSKQIATVSPSSTQMARYTPTNSAQGCPAVNGSWSAAPTLPPIPYARLCTCMMDSLECTVDPGKDQSVISGMLGSICSKDKTLCAGALSKPAQGTYGAFVGCNSTEQASWIFNQYYISQDRAESACSDGRLQIARQYAGGDCFNLLRQAGTDGSGTITSTPNAPAATESGNASQSSGGSGAPNVDNGNGGWLSGGAIAGIVVGTVGGIALISLAFFFWRRRQKKKNGAALLSDDSQARGDKPELGDTSRPRPELEEFYGPGTNKIGGQPAEAPSQNRFEMPGSTTAPVELPAPHGRNEADTIGPVASST